MENKKALSQDRDHRNQHGEEESQLSKLVRSFPLKQDHQLFSDWTYSSYKYGKYPEDYPIKPLPHPILSTTEAFAAFISCSPKSMDSFWVHVNHESAYDPRTQISIAISQNLQKYTNNLSVCVFLNDIPDTITIQQGKENLRTIYHFIVEEKPDPIQYILESTPINTVVVQSGIHVIDCDYATSLYDYYLEKLTTNDDLYVFFACGEEESFPCLPDLPPKFFSSCLSCPEKAVLLWHSWHYHSFSYAALTPLKLRELNVDESFCSQIYIVVSEVIESALFNALDPELFVLLMKNDDLLRRYIVGFIIARQILEPFRIHPKSIPEIPLIDQPDIWSLLNLKMDGVLHAFNTHSPFTDAHFISYGLKSFTNLIQSSFSKDLISPSLSILSRALLDPTLTDEACKALHIFLQQSSSHSMYAWAFQYIRTLSKLFFNLNFSKSLFGCINTLLWTSPGASQLFDSIDSLFILNNLFPLLSEPWNEEVYLFLLLNVNNSFSFKSILGKMEIPYNAPVGVFQLLLMASLNTQPSDCIINLTEKALELDPQHRLALIIAWKSFLNKSYDIILIGKVEHLIYDINPLVRHEIAAFLTTAYPNLDEEFGKHVLLLIQPLTNDPSQLVSKHVGSSHPDSKIYEYLITDYLLPTKHQMDPYKSNHTPYTQLKKIFHFVYDGEITSSIAISPQRLFFGDKNGTLLCLPTEPNPKILSSNLSSVPLTECTFLENSGFHLLCCSDTKGIFRCFSLPNDRIQILSSFQLHQSFDGCNVSFNIDEFNGILTCFDRKTPTSLFLIDLHNEQRIGSIENMSFLNAHSIQTFSSVVMTCGSDLKMFDIRTSLMHPILETEQRDPIFDCYGIYGENNILTLTDINCQTFLFDWRNNKKIMTYKLADQFGEVTPSVCSAHQREPFFYLGCNKGGSLLHSTEKIRVDNTVSTGLINRQILPVNAARFHPTENSYAIVTGHSNVLYYSFQ